MLARYGSEAGFSVAPTTRTCWLKVPANWLTITGHQRLGDVLRELQADVLASIVGVLPTAGMSETSGVVMRPSGRTWTFAPSSSLRQTWIVSSSSGPITYSSPGPSCIATKLAGASCGPPPPAQPESAAGDRGAAIRRDGGSIASNASFRIA
jgi:hypothetical protein